MLSRALGSCSPEDIATDAVVSLVQEAGLAAVTMRGIARRLRMNPGIVNQWFGDREGMLRAVTYRLGARRIHWLDHRLGVDGVTGMLPPVPGTLLPSLWGPGLDAHDDAMIALRTWLALTEVARSTPMVAAAMAEVMELERNLLADQRCVPAERIDGLLALVDGLQCSLFPPRGLPLEQACSLLAEFAKGGGLAA